MQNYQHAKRCDSAKGRTNRKRVMQQKRHGHAESSSQPTINCTLEYNIIVSDSSESENSESTQGSGSNYMTPFEDCQSPTNQPVINTKGYSDLGDQLIQCRYCKAQMWYDERISKNKNFQNPRFILCCGDGKAEMPLLQNPPEYLQQLLFHDDTIDSKNYQHNLQAYNMMFAFASAGIKLDKTINNSRGPPTIRIQGQPCHKIGILLPMPGKKPKFAQLYIFDTKNEVQNRINVMSSKRDIIVETQNGELQRIHELHPNYLPLKYPLLFPYGEDGYRADILHRCTSSNKKRKLQSRSNEALTLLHSRKLFQQFIVEGYTMVESERLSYIRNNQKKLRVDKYSSLQTSLDTRTAKGLTKGKRVILPSTFVGSPRYMDQLYFDDRPDIVSRIFILKYEHMLSDLTKGQLLGKVVAYMHTIEFQKRALPHVHLLLFLHPDNKYTSSTDIDKIISAEIPSHQDDPELYRLTLLDSNDYPFYRRRNNGHSISKNGVIIDNRYVVPYNPKLLKKYCAHINIECTSTKYLFKYINKGYDRVTAVMLSDSDNAAQNVNIHNDELKEYLDCRKPVVERLYFHLPDQHNIIYEDHDDIDDVLSKPTILD
uniref:Helitron helicase-like domain-containing protein n=1 Tax=Glycine max TaxID=3847 RepID=A0A0R0JUR6_SOYBN